MKKRPDHEQDASPAELEKLRDQLRKAIAVEVGSKPKVPRPALVKPSGLRKPGRR